VCLFMFTVVALLLTDATVATPILTTVCLFMFTVVALLLADATVVTPIFLVKQPSAACQFIWGGSRVSRAVDPASLWCYQWMLHDITPGDVTSLLDPPPPAGCSVSLCVYVNHVRR